MKRPETVAIIGMSKNAGKTTVLNSLIRQLSRRKRLGVLSIGVDGEERDAWSGREKPAIRCDEGMLVVSAASCFNLYPGSFEMIGSCGFQSAMGEILLGKARRGSRIKLAGIPGTGQVQAAIRKLKGAGAELVLVDGAYDRKSLSSPLISDAVILVVGACLHRSLPQVVKKAAELLAILRLPAAPSADRFFHEQAQTEKKVIGVVQGMGEPLPFSTLLEWKEKREAFSSKNWEVLIIPGSLTDRMLRMLMEEGVKARLIVPDATHCFFTHSMLRRFLQWGGAVEVVYPTRLLGVAVNPVSPDGYAFPPSEMKERIAAVAAPLPVFDVVRDPLLEGGWEDVLR
ncbi:hypothetical protein H1164_03090 [Thermoactinomyces daqus]|uniref:Uncharacterized protein n=1 Tax=Thermoactinomyces daqus TaxID=1329516 RepID=A0A7W2AG62_9BACL|nr:hypothetical protein [Thermoactinomyces daqus]MBA4541887.1 hypothetical protein [Thermoactinomyces daqus]